MKIRKWKGRNGPACQGKKDAREVKGAELLDGFNHIVKAHPRIANGQGGSSEKVKRSIQNTGIHFALSP